MRKNIFEIIAMVVFVIAVAGVLMWQSIYGMTFTWFGIGKHGHGESEINRESDEIFNTLGGEYPDTKREAVSVTIENFRAVIESIVIPPDFTWEATVKTHFNDKALTNTVHLEYEGEKYKLDILQKDRTVKEVVDNGDVITVTEYSPALTSAEYPSDTSDVFAEGMLPSVYGFLNLPDDTTEFSYNLYKGVYGSLADLEFSYTLGKERFSENYTISLDYGIVISAKTYQGEELVYELETTKLSPHAAQQ